MEPDMSKDCAGQDGRVPRSTRMCVSGPRPDKAGALNDTRQSDNSFILICMNIYICYIGYGSLYTSREQA
jgi:hypothetical protein